MEGGRGSQRSHFTCNDPSSLFSNANVPGVDGVFGLGVLAFTGSSSPMMIEVSFNNFRLVE
jgi:hypothetical protein